MHRTGVVSQRLVLQVVHMEQLVAETRGCDLSPSHLCPGFHSNAKLRILRKIVNGSKKKTNLQLGLAKIAKIRNFRNSCQGLVFSSFSVFCGFCDFNGFCENCEFCEKEQQSRLLSRTCVLQLSVCCDFCD